jgi:hypothetical protein
MLKRLKHYNLIVIETCLQGQTWGRRSTAMAEFIKNYKLLEFLNMLFKLKI